MSKRAIRRHHKERLKRTRRNYWAMDWNRKYNQLEVENKLIGIVINTPHPCSKMCCGNQRQYEGSPIRELRQPNINDY
ncbi:MAG: hypothetical protein H8D97_00070 [Proteobacteria bacterium]|nr:hypothetical protein [Pseudomonadota bacterium]